MKTQGGNFDDMVFKPGDPSVVHAVTSGRYFRSTDGGNNFTEITNGLPNSGDVRRYMLGVTQDDPSYVYILGGAADGGYLGLWRSTDGGNSFNLRSDSPDILQRQTWYDMTIDVSPTDKNTLLAGAVPLQRSTDGGASYTQVGGGFGSNVHVDQHEVEFEPGDGVNVYVCNDGGVYNSTSSGASGTWDDISAGLEIAQIYRMGITSDDKDLALTGWQDNGINRRQPGNDWDHVLGADGMECVINPSNKDIMYAANQNGRIAKTFDQGFNFNYIVGSNGSGVNSAGAWITPYILNPKAPNHLLIAKSNLYKSFNGGGDFKKISLPGGGNADALAMAPSDTSYIYMSKGSDIYVAKDGKNFNDITSGLPNLSISYIEVDESNPEKVWVTLSGYSSGNKVYMTKDAGSNWTNISDGLPNLPANTIAHQEGTNNGIYVGMDVGVYYTNDSLSKWKSFFNNLPNVIVNELDILENHGVIRAATYGRGLWESDLYNYKEIDAASLGLIDDQTICSKNFNPKVKIKNEGADLLSSVNINYNVDGGSVKTFSWTGRLQTNETEVVGLPSISTSKGTHTFKMYVDNPNNTTDENNKNDTVSNTFTVQGGKKVDMELELDCYGEEIAWSVKDTNGTLIDSVSYDTYEGGDGDPFFGGDTVAQSFCLTESCYEYTIYDSYGDGLNGSARNCSISGDYRLTSEVEDTLVELNSANYGSSKVDTFCIDTTSLQASLGANDKVV
ncbi:MAG: WD40/YVTN/BNR-like repeat-containing protein, partial [Flavobacteriales bacterium]